MKKYTLTYKVTIDIDAFDDVDARQRAEIIHTDEVSCTASLESILAVHEALSAKTKRTLRDKERVVRL